MRSHHNSCLTILAASIAAAGAGACAAPATAATTTITPLNGDTAVRAYEDVQVWSDLDPGDKRWHVYVRRNGTIAPTSIPAAKGHIDVDVGAGTSGGEPVLAYLSCSGGCQIVTATLTGAGAHTVPGSAGASNPTIDGGHVAWVKGRATVMTSTVTGHARRVLGGAPAKKCQRDSPNAAQHCDRTVSAYVDALELNGSQLALVASFGRKSEEETTEVRTESIKGGPQRLVASMSVGEAGQTWVGPSWAKGKLFFYKACVGDSSGCSGSAGGAFSFDPARRAYAQASSAIVLSGFAVAADGRSAYETTYPGDLPCTDPEAAPCLLRLSSLTFKARRAGPGVS